MKRIKNLLTVLSLGSLTLTFTPHVGAQVVPAPALMDFQGRLAHPDGTPVVDGTNSVRFSLWDAESGGTEKWSQTNDVVTANGVFDVLLGVDAAGLFNCNLWMEIQIGTDVPLSPRQQLVSTAYAMKANSVPDGSIGAAQIVSGSLTADKFAPNAFNPLAWLLGGNSGINPVSQFLGTTDNQPLVFRTNNTERMRLSSAGDIGLQ